MKHGLNFVLGLALALIFAGGAASAVVVTAMTVKDAVQSHGSLEAFEARIRHYSDRWASEEDGLRLIRAPHPFALHFGMLVVLWVVTIASAAGLRYLQRRR